jgi:hypothetical protein
LPKYVYGIPRGVFLCVFAFHNADIEKVNTHFGKLTMKTCIKPWLQIMQNFIWLEITILETLHELLCMQTPWEWQDIKKGKK